MDYFAFVWPFKFYLRNYYVEFLFSFNKLLLDVIITVLFGATISFNQFFTLDLLHSVMMKTLLFSACDATKFQQIHLLFLTILTYMYTVALRLCVF
jgi:hypothetical protein